MKKHTITRLLVLLLVLAIAVPYLPVVVSANDGGEVESFAAQLADYDSRTEFVINNKDDLKACMSSGKSFDGKTVKLGADIAWNEGTASSDFTFTMADTNATAELWTPVPEFGGDTGATFDGQGHTLSGIVITVTGTTSNNGMFKSVKNATFKNLIINNSVFTSTKTNNESNGFIAGIAYQTNTFTNVHVSAYQKHAVNTYNGRIGKVGGMVGSLATSNTTTTFTGCTVSGVVEASSTHVVGGILGTSAGAAMKVEMTDCVNYATVKANNYAAGLVGRQCGIGNFTRSTSVGKVSVSVKTDTAAGTTAHAASLVALRAIESTYTAALSVNFNDCYHSTASNDSAITVDVASQRFKITVSGSDPVDYRNTALTTPELAAELTAKVSEFKKGSTSSINVYGVQQSLDNTRARFITTFKTNDYQNESTVRAIGFNISALGKEGVSKDCPCVYESIRVTSPNGEIQDIKAGEGIFANADYLATCIIPNVPTNANGYATLVVSSYIITKNGTRIESTKGALILTFSGGSIVGIAHTI